MALTADQILALAPDAASAKAGSAQASAAKWSGLGSHGQALWGLCQGSGKDPYRAQMLSRAAALDDKGAPSYDHRHAAHFATLGIPCFACTPDKFPDLMAAAIKKQDMSAWAAQHDIAIAG